MRRFPTLYPEDVERLEKVLRTLVQNCAGRASLLIHPEGNCLGEGGAFRGGDRREFCAQAVTFWKETLNLVRSVSEDPPAFLSIPLEKMWVCLQPVFRGSLLAVLCENDATLGKVRLYSSQAVSKLRELLEEIDERTGEGKRISREFEKDSDPPGPWPLLPA